MTTRAILGLFAILAAAVINGALRDLFIRPRLGFFASEVYGALILSAVVLLVAKVVMRPAQKNSPTALRISVLWLSLTLAFEFLFFHYVTGHSWNELMAAYKFWEGRLWSVVLVVVAAGPFFAARSSPRVR